MKLTRLLLAQEVRVRFAPSPTGKLHLGGLRTVVVNYLFAKSHVKGRFVLRIEDTDQNRIIPGAAEALFDTLKWLKMEPDESPIHGGKYGPYVQSQRRDLYLKAVESLLENGSAYRCFCSEDRLMLLRKHALQNRETPKYDNRCRNLSEMEIEENLAKRQPYTIRFKLRAAPNSFRDLIYGDIEHDLAATEGDPVLLKSDRWPTYHLANVVDDHHMKISHVLRGQEWLISTVKHLQLYAAFDWTPPAYAHLPLLAHQSGKKLSKRDKDAFVEHYKDAGYEPVSLVNFVTRGGGGFPGRNFDEKKIYDLVELAEMFDLSAMKTHSVKVDMPWLQVFNKLAIEQLPSDELLRRVSAKVAEKYGEGHLKSLDSKGFLDADSLRRSLEYFVPRIETLNDFVTKPDFTFLWTVPEQFSPETFQERTIGMLKDIQKMIGDLEDNFAISDVTQELRKYCNKETVNFKALMHFMRKGLTGSVQGPPVGEIVLILGKTASVSRLKHLESLLH